MLFNIFDENTINKWCKMIDNFGRFFFLIKRYLNQDRGDDFPSFDNQIL